MSEANTAARDTDVLPAETAELHRKAVQAALDLNEHGWACIEGVLPE